MTTAEALARFTPASAAFGSNLVNRRVQFRSWYDTQHGAHILAADAMDDPWATVGDTVSYGPDTRWWSASRIVRRPEDVAPSAGAILTELVGKLLEGEQYG